MQPTVWRPFGFLAIIGLSLVFCETAKGLDLKTGIHGMAWTSPASEHAHLTQVRTAGPVGYFVNRNMVYRVSNQPVPGVIYGFFEDRLFAAYIKLQSPNQAYYMRKHFNTSYGPAKVTSTGDGNQTVYRWQEGDLKIKLKIWESGDNIKLGIYYKPLTTQPTPLRTEPTTSQTSRDASQAARSHDSAPLL